MLKKTVFPVILWASLPLASAGQVFVSETDPTCGGEAPCFTTIQAAVDFAAPGNEVSVAAGTYTGVAAVDLGGHVYHQVVMITESLRLQGGYTNDNWLIPDPELNETIIDAEGAGRGISVVGTRDHTVTISGFTIRDGDYSDLGNADGESTVCPRTSADCGGGLLVREVEIHIDSCKFLDNIASETRQYSDGGGALLWRNGPGSPLFVMRLVSLDFSTLVIGRTRGGGFWPRWS